MVDEDQLAVLLDSFAAAWGALSRIFRAPADSELLAALAQPGQLSSWPLDRDELTERGLRLLTDSLALPESLADLERDFDRLFVGPGPLMATPYESVFLSNDHLMFEAPTREVRAAYADYGLATTRLGREPDDHIGLEMAFLAHLCTRALDHLEAQDPAGLTRCLESHARFLDEHLLRWADQCLTLVDRHAQTLFYRSAAALGLATLEQAQQIRPA